jgi:hypothetical protein
MNVAKLFRLLSEFLMLLLGGMLLLLALTGRVGRPARPAAFVFLGAVLVYWGLRAPLGLERSRRPTGQKDSTVATQSDPRFLQILQAVSLSVLGLAVVGISLAGVRYTAWLLALAGASLVLRGLLASLYLVRRA